jgi:hypothetical protein
VSASLARQWESSQSGSNQNDISHLPQLWYRKAIHTGMHVATPTHYQGNNEKRSFDVVAPDCEMYKQYSRTKIMPSIYEMQRWRMHNVWKTARCP